MKIIIDIPKKAYEIIKAEKEIDWLGVEYILDCIKSGTPLPKMGKWIFHKPFDNGHKNCNECIECNQCHTWFGYDCYAKTSYCPNCGAKMIEIEEGE